jgi:hypothetical protein
MPKKIFTALLYVCAAIGVFFILGYFAVRFGLTNTNGIIDTQREGFLNTASSTSADLSPHYPQGTPWENTEEWEVIAVALTKDQSVLVRAANDSGVPARLIAANLITEQLRLFFTEREAYKKFFYPLKILGPQSQFSWGVMGMKEETAIQVEQHLKDQNSPYYLGPAYEHALDFTATTTDISRARFVRMTDQYNHYWSYLYAGLFIKQIEAQWARAGFPISNNPAIISTLYNIGFEHSTPKADPQVGGAAITINGVTKSFGALSAEFYNSKLLFDIFPR